MRQDYFSNRVMTTDQNNNSANNGRERSKFPEEVIINEFIPSYDTDGAIRKLLRERGNLDVNFLNSFGHTPLETAAYSGSVRFVKLLLELGADVTLQDTDGWTALHFAVATKNYEIAKILLSAGADLGQATHDGLKALDFIKDKKTRISLARYNEMCIMSHMRTSYC